MTSDDTLASHIRLPKGDILHTAFHGLLTRTAGPRKTCIMPSQRSSSASSSETRSRRASVSTGSSLNRGDSRGGSGTLPGVRRELGLRPQAPINEEHNDAGRQKLLWSRIKITLREPFMEFWGVVIMVVFGNGTVAQVLFATKLNAAPGGNNVEPDYQTINWG